MANFLSVMAGAIIGHLLAPFFQHQFKHLHWYRETRKGLHTIKCGCGKTFGRSSNVDAM